MTKEEYIGDLSMAIVEFQDKYSPRIAASPAKLRAHLKLDFNCLGEEYRVLELYDFINSMACVEIGKAIKRLQLGERIDLTAILD